MVRSSSYEFLGDGLAASRIREVDWNRTSLGDMSSWSESLRSLVGTLLRSSQAMQLMLGDDLVQLYNDAYIAAGVSKHPTQMGEPTAVTWPDAYPLIADQIDEVLHGGRSIRREDLLLPMQRHDRLVDTYWTYTHSPFVDGDGVIRGVLAIPVETTHRVLAVKRQAAVDSMTKALARCRSLEDLLGTASAELAACVDCGVGSIRSYKSPKARWAPAPCGRLQPSVDALVDDEAIISRVSAEPALWQRLQHGDDVRAGRHVLMALVNDNASGMLRFVAYGINARLDLNDAYESFLRQITDRLSQAVNRLEAAAAIESSVIERDELLMQAPIATAVLTGPDLVFTLANERYYQVVGRRDVLGKTYEQAFPELAETELAPLLHRLYDTGAEYISPETLVLLDRRGTGELDRRFVQFTIHPLRRIEGDVFALICVAVDMTDQVEARERASARHEERRVELEEMVRTRTQSLEELNATLARSRDEAEAASRSKSAFLANMSHEIRTPLNAILGMTHIVARRIDDVGQRAQLGKVEAAARHLLGLVSDVLDLSKIEAGKLVLAQNDFVISELVHSAMELVREPAARKGLRLQSEIADLPTHLRGDALRLSQILINLLSNAVKFTSRGSVVLRANVVERCPARACLRFEVQDTGIGIDASQQARLFGAFQQADDSITRQHGGTGLGLAVSRQLARAMGGDAGMRSEPGVGSTFWFTAWLEPSPTQADQPQQQYRLSAADHTRSVSAMEAQVRALHGGQRVLLAEDNPVNREVAVALLEYAGLAVETAHDGAQAVARVDKTPVDLVLMDMQMPRVGGLEATRLIRAASHTMPIIAMTANAFTDDRDACLQAGMDDHVPKPVDPLQLYGVLLRWLPGKG